MSTPLDKLEQLLNLGPANWRERLAKEIKLISPEGNEFSAHWQRGPRSKDKKVAIFSYPKVRGNPVQDLEVDSSRYDFSIFFEGANNDIEARQFYAACGEKGTWEITHPVHGFLVLQLLSVTENIDPTDSGNITELATSWIEPIDEITLKTGRELAGIVDAKNDDLNISAADQYVNTIRTGTETLTNTVKKATEIQSKLIKKTLNPLSATVDAIDDTMTAISTGIQDTLDAAIFQPLTLAAQVQQLTQYPLLATNDIFSRLDYYGGLADEILGSLAAGNKDSDLNLLGTSELGLTAILGSFGLIATSGTLETRAQAVEVAENVSGLFSTMVEQLEVAQENFQGNDIDDQYFSQSQSYTDAALLVGYVLRYLLITGFDLKVEKRIILDRPRPPIWLAFKEYGNLDSYDLFIESNGLTAEELLMLPAGKEVLIYV